MESIKKCFDLGMTSGVIVVERSFVGELSRLVAEVSTQIPKGSSIDVIDFNAWIGAQAGARILEADFVLVAVGEEHSDFAGNDNYLGYGARVLPPRAGKVERWLRAHLEGGLSVLKEAHYIYLEEVCELAQEAPVYVEGFGYFQASERDISRALGLLASLAGTAELPKGWQGWRGQDNQMVLADGSVEDVRSFLNSLVAAKAEQVQAAHGRMWADKKAVFEAASEEDVESLSR